MKSYFLKEYGSWSVLLVAYIAGLFAGGRLTPEAFPVLIALAMLVNSKQAFTLWLRQRRDTQSLTVFLGQVAFATLLLLYVFHGGVAPLLPLLIIPAAYLAVNRIAGEHALATEVLGFLLLSLAAPIAKYAVSLSLDYRLFIAVAVFFCVGVFKIRVQLRKTDRDRIVSATAVAAGVVIYLAAKLPLILLLPLADNLLFSAVPYQVKLKTTGWIEVAKSVVFLVLIAIYYS